MALQHSRSQAAKEDVAGFADAEPDPPRLLHRRLRALRRVAAEPGPRGDRGLV